MLPRLHQLQLSRRKKKFPSPIYIKLCQLGIQFITRHRCYLEFRDAAFDPGNIRQIKLDAPHDVGAGDEDRVIDEALGNTDAVVEAVKNGKLLAIESGGNQLAES